MLLDVDVYVPECGAGDRDEAGSGAAARGIGVSRGGPVSWRGDGWASSAGPTPFRQSH